MHMNLKYVFAYHFVHVVSGKETDGNEDVKVEEEETFEKPIEQNVRMTLL
jgi:hypothetical protein